MIHRSSARALGGAGLLIALLCWWSWVSPSWAGPGPVVGPLKAPSTAAPPPSPSPSAAASNGTPAGGAAPVAGLEDLPPGGDPYGVLGPPRPEVQGGVNTLGPGDVGAILGGPRVVASPKAGASPGPSASAAPFRARRRLKPATTPAGGRRSRRSSRPSQDPFRPVGKQFTSAVQCAQCHDTHYDQWAKSMHAQSATDPLFKKVLARAVAVRGSRIKDSCYSCHAPLAVLTKDTRLEKAITREGITCDVCHSISAVDRSYDTPLHYHTAPGTIRGPYKDTTGPHPSVHSELLTSSRVCAACHQGALDAHQDFQLFDTYGEWERSSYSSGAVDLRTGHDVGRPETVTRCQDCHMPARSGAAAKDGPWREVVRDHTMQGAQHEGFVGTGVSFHMTARRSPDRRAVKVTVQTHNKGAGHFVPTDFPDRRLVVEVVGLGPDFQQVFRETRRYGKIFADAKGRSPVPFFQAASIASDSRIAPGEVRSEHFSFAIDRPVTQIRAQLLYFHIGDDLFGAYRTEVEPMVIEERSERLGR